jgi:polysaccharide biosynthesis transport protein
MELELAEAEQRSLALEDVAVRFHALRNQVQADRDAHSQIVERLNETRIASQLDHVNIKIVDMADTPYLPVEPNLQRIILQSAFLGCFIFIGLPLGLGMIDNKLKASWEVELLLGLPMLGEIPRLSGIKKQDRPHLISQNKDHAACEAFRGIFSQIQLNSPLDLPRIILVTSTVPGEGKSMVCSNLAATFAAHGKRTLLVDCDFRRPSMNKHYERKNDRGIMKWVEAGQDHPGLLEDNEFLDIVPLSNNLHLLRTGGDSRNPTEMFDKPGFRTLFEQFKADYDVILIDTPPVGIFPDALLLSRLCDQIIYVCQFNRVNKTQIRKFMDKVETAHVEMAGLILNGIPSGKTSAYYDYYGYGQVGNKEYKAYYAQKR